MRAKIIAEVTSNHGGDIGLACEFIREAAKAGADYVKFQSWQADHLRDGKKDPQWEWFSRSELSDQAHYELMEEAKRCKIRFLTTIFHEDRIPFIKSLGLTEIKIGSAESPNAKLLKKARDNFEHLIVSTGMSDLAEIKSSLPILCAGRFTLMHCVSLYPTPPELLQMNFLNALREFAPSVGYSDSFIGAEACKLAIAMGADIIEKHFCLESKNLEISSSQSTGAVAIAAQAHYGPKGRAMPWDATPQQLKEIVHFAHLREKMAGNGQKVLTKEITKTRQFFFGRFRDQLA